MQHPDGYADRVRAHPYGPVEVTAGQVVSWLHGPYVVLAFTGCDGSCVTVTGVADDVGLALDLATFFEAATLECAELAGPQRLTVEQPAGGGEPARVTRLRAGEREGMWQLTLQIDASIVDVRLDRVDAEAHAVAIRAWADTFAMRAQMPAAGARPGSA